MLAFTKMIVLLLMELKNYEAILKQVEVKINYVNLSKIRVSVLLERDVITGIL